MTTQTPKMSRAELLRASPPMFESKLLDKLSRVHPAVPVIIFAPAITAFVVVAAINMSALPVIGYAAYNDVVNGSFACRSTGSTGSSSTSSRRTGSARAFTGSSTACTTTTRTTRSGWSCRHP